MNQEIFEVTTFHAKRGCLSYLLTDRSTHEAILIDPSLEIIDEYRAYLQTHPEVKLVWLLETHTHADHVSAAKILREETGAKIVMSVASPSPSKDRALEDGERILFGKSEVTTWKTSGHTNESLVFVGKGLVFTGDTLLIGGTGRTDFQLGESEALYESLERVLMLPRETIVYPGHDYQGRQSSTIGAEMRQNARLRLVVEGKRDEFLKVMDAHHPPLPELFEESLRENSK
jgi:glyoxylase-like metal-dependent hydrolase (beta-lactamase superfamily II)